MSSPAAQLPSPAAPVARRGSRERTLPLTALLAGFIVLQSALTGFSTQVDVPGGLSVQGLLTLSYAGISVLVLLASPTLPRPAFKAFWPVMLFLGFSLLALGWYTLTIVGVQNLSAFASFVGVFVLCATWARDDERFGGMLMKVFWWAVAIASFQYLVVAALYGPGQTENPIMPARPFAMFALIGLAAVLAGWRYGNRAGLFLGLLVVATIGISLSRTSLIVSVVLLALMWIPARGVKGWLRLAALAALAVFSLNWAIYNIPALHDRFFEGDVTLGAGGVAVNASGRTLVWQIVVDSWQDSPWIGKGPGSANPPLEARLPGRGINGHPHNDYLRVLHDYGIVGLSLWLFAIVNLMARLYRFWSFADARRYNSAPMLLASILALIGFMGMMATDNPIVYGFFTAPLAVLLGTALGTFSRERRDDTATTA